MKARIRKKSEALEDSAVVKLVCATDQQFAIGALACKIATQAISYVIDTAPYFRCCDHIDQRTRRV